MENQLTITTIQETINTKELSQTLRMLLEQLVINLDELDELLDESEKGNIRPKIKIPTMCRTIKGINKNILSQELDENLYGLIISLNAVCTMKECGYYHTNAREESKNINEKSHKKSHSHHM